MMQLPKKRNIFAAGALTVTRQSHHRGVVPHSTLGKLSVISVVSTNALTFVLAPFVLTSFAQGTKLVKLPRALSAPKLANLDL